MDHATVEQLRAKYPNIPSELITGPDAIWGKQTLADAVNGRRFDYILASHVVEHVPDLIGWFRELADVLAPEGEIRLVVPDRRYTFDYHRKETRLADVLAARVVRARVPQPQQILEFHSHYAEISALDAWAGRVPQMPAMKPKEWMESAAKALHGEYVDVHCWVFTPRSWARLMEDLTACGLMPCSCSTWEDTRPMTYEFIVGLRHGTGGWEPMLEARQDSVEDQLQAEITALRGSTSWRITAPLRWMVERVRNR